MEFNIDEQLNERLELAVNRIDLISDEDSVDIKFKDYFSRVSKFILKMNELYQSDIEQKVSVESLEELSKWNEELYMDILPGNYSKSYADPTYAKEMLGEDYYKVLSFLYTEIRGMIVFAFEKRLEEFVITMELFLEIYHYFEEELLPRCEMLTEAVYWFESDYTDLNVANRIKAQIDPSVDFAQKIIMKSDLSDVRYLYLYGEYITSNELKVAEYLNQLSEEEVQSMADTYTEGYRMGFINTNKDLSKKEVVNIRYCVGFERMVLLAIKNFEKMGLKPTIYRAAVMSVNKRSHHKIGYFSTSANRQYDYDHKNDQGLYLDKNFVERKLGVVRNTYEKLKELAYKHAGPAVIEIFGEEPFEPMEKPEAVSFTDKQQKLLVYYDGESSQIVNEYIRGDERSFTIIAYPVPTIGEQFEEIFKETVRLNTLDYKKYEKIQQHLIDALDQGVSVHVKGSGLNKTDIKVALYPLKNKEKETIFENCVADVNIPVGEVFTSPVLKNTTGKLHVTSVYLNELEYKNLELDFKDGLVQNYICDNFTEESKNKKFIKDNLLFHHDTLPLGEFAIGTNTTAYVMAEKYQIAKKLPILIAEKMGPHFAIGDTCYSRAEDVTVFNPDGKEIVAKENEISSLRKENPEKAYYHCHTDITIPYDELEIIEVILADNSTIKLIENGRFVLDGTKELNEPFEK